MDNVRRQGFATNVEETVEGSVLVGAPIFDAAGKIAAAISVSVPTPRRSPEKEEKITRAIVREASGLSADLAQLGFHSKASAATGIPATAPV